MNFYSVRDLRTKSIWDTLISDNEVVITNNGKPSALMINIPEGEFDDVVQAVRQARAMMTLNSMRRKAASHGYMTDDEINAEISKARK